MKILVIGGGGREHAVIAALAKSPKVTEIHAAPGNGGIAATPKVKATHNVKSTDIPGIVTLAEGLKPDWVFVTPDDPLVLGAVDELQKAGFKTFGPRKNAAILEGSKSFSKDFMKRHAIPTADYRDFIDAGEAISYIKSQNTYPTVIKCDGLALGKGVIIAQNEAEAVSAVNSMMVQGKFGESGKCIVIEEFLDGVEVTVLAFTDGETLVAMPASTDHKRALDGDRGLNTGGMGVVTPVPYYTTEIAEECMRSIFLPTVKGMSQEGRAFQGCLYFGLMLPRTGKGVKVVEYNCRFGDPEAQTVLPLLETDLLDIMEAVHEKRLAEINVKFSDKKAACVVMASGGYPEKYETGYVITGLNEVNQDNIHVFHAGTALSPDNGNSQPSGLVTSGGRVLAVTAVSDTLESAVGDAYAAVGKICFKDAHYRTDIGKKALEAD